MGYSATLLQQLSAIEVEIERIDESLAATNQPLDVAFSLESVRDFVATKALDLQGAFDTEPGKARQILANHIERLILTPRDAEDGPVYDVSGDIDLFGVDQRTMSLVVDACMGRSGKAKRGAKRTAAIEDANMYRVDRKGVMATDPVSGHHIPIKLAGNQRLANCAAFEDASIACEFGRTSSILFGTLIDLLFPRPRFTGRR